MTASCWMRNGASCARIWRARMMCSSWVGGGSCCGLFALSSTPPLLSFRTSAGWVACCRASVVWVSGVCGGVGSPWGFVWGAVGGWDHWGASMTAWCASRACCVWVSISLTCVCNLCCSCLGCVSGPPPGVLWSCCRSASVSSSPTCAATSPPPHVCQSFTLATCSIRWMPLRMSSAAVARVCVSCQ